MSGTQWYEDDSGQTPAWPPATPGGGELPDSGGSLDQPEPGQDAPAEPAPRPRGRRRLVAAAGSVAAVVVIAVVALVVTSSTGQTAAQAFAAAVHQSASLRSLSAVMSEQVSGATSETISGTLQAERSPVRLSMKLSVNAAGSAIPISGIVTSNAMYLKLGVALPLPATVQGKWIEIPFARLGPSSEFASLVHSFEDDNPVSALQVLLAVKDVRDAGTQTVDGMQTTKYTGSFTPSAALKLLPASERTATGQALKLVKGNVAVSVWTHGGQIVKYADVEHLVNSTVTVSVRYLSVNKPVSIAVPPASQVWVPPVSSLEGQS
jgi:hypothetical protein